MTTDLNQVFDGYPIPDAEDHFTEPQTPPFVAWTEEKESLFADGKVWDTLSTFTVDLYTRQNTRTEEARLEKWLSDHNLRWQQESKVWDDTEQIFWSSYHVG